MLPAEFTSGQTEGQNLRVLFHTCYLGWFEDHVLKQTTQQVAEKRDIVAYSQHENKGLCRVPPSQGSSEVTQAGARHRALRAGTRAISRFVERGRSLAHWSMFPFICF